MEKRIQYRCVIFIFIFCLVGSFVCLPITASAAVSPMKKKYTKRYSETEKACKKSFDYDGTTSDMNRDARAEYKIWDKELNKIYKDIYSTLDDREKKCLKKSEIKWIRKKEEKAQKAADNYFMGSMAGVACNSSLIHLTKARILWLIRKYL